MTYVSPFLAVAPTSSSPDAPAAASVHRPVMVAEVLAHLERRPGGVVVDATVGGGGHAEAILNALPPDTAYVGLDRDAAALARARARLAPYGARVALHHADFRELARAAAPYARRVTNVLFDLGLSSDQLADGARGFSFDAEGALDMRFDEGAGGATAAEVVNTFPEKELADLIYELGQEPRARTVARAIAARRRQWPIATAAELAQVVARAIPRGKTHAATRTFQALRIYVNDELGALGAALPAAADLLAPGGRLLVIAYHSLEDGTVKRFVRAAAAAGTLETITPKPLRPSRPEVIANPRSRSARLRVAART